MSSASFAREWSRNAVARGHSALGRTRGPWVTRLRLLVDAAAWLGSMVIGALTLGASPLHALLVGCFGAVVQLLAGTSVGLYRGKWRLASFDEAAVLAAVTAVVAAILGGVRIAASLADTTLAMNPLAPFAALTGMLLARGIRRSTVQASRRPGTGDRVPVLIYGAGDGGTQMVNAMLGNPTSRYVPIALIDDDPAKANLRIRGVPVRGSRKDLAHIAATTGSELVIVAIPSASSSTIRLVSEQAARVGLEVRVLPPTQELVDGIVSLADLREVTDADLLGRRAIETDIESIAGYLRGRRVLVTGAGGSIGSELCRQINAFDPSKLVMLDRDESALHAVQLSIEGHGLLDSRNLVVADIRDASRLEEVFTEHDPHVVFHAAALKHLPLLELYPVEGWKTNVEGTNNVLRAAAKSGVTHFVNVSTDKAADPTSVLGYTKRIAEQLTAWYANRTRGDWVSVRFGNVLGSRGSVLEGFRAQIAAGGPLTVTHRDVTRYFMTPTEACQLVIQAAAVGDRGEALVLDMGEPIRILEVAERLVASSAHPIEIVFTGLRDGEKLHESLVSEIELDIRRAHPLISHVDVPALTPAQLGLFDMATPEVAKASMARLTGHQVVADTLL